MASLVNQAGAVGGGGGDPLPFRVVQATGDIARIAMARLLSGDGEGGPGADRATGRSVWEAADEAGVIEGLARGQASRLWVAVLEDGSVGEVAQVVPSSGRTAGIYLAPASARGARGAAREGTRRQRVAVINAACEALSRGEYGETVLAQGLLEPSEVEAADAYLQAGFYRLAELAYLRREVSRFARYDRPDWESAGVRVTRMSEMPWDTGQTMLALAMDASYEGTLDCPALCGMRTVDDVLDSHKSVGAFDPSLWWLVIENGRPCGCMLLSRFPAHDTVELVYLGVGAALRGRGIGAGLLGLALAELQALGEKSLACAVDMNNAPALSLYKRAKFKEFARRTALIRDLRPPQRGPART